ncbi:MAG: hypothetical protein WCG35_10455 [Betaproteobacteria bacterium]
MLAAVNVNAGLFGASNYEECMSDGKVGRTEQEMQVLNLKCQKQFPKLPKLFGMKNSTVFCVSSDGNAKDTYRFTRNELIVESGKHYPLTVRTSEIVVVKANWVQRNDTKKDFPTTFTLTPLDGSAKIVALETGLKYPPSYFYDCIEK